MKKLVTVLVIIGVILIIFIVTAVNWRFGKDIDAH